MTRKTLIAVALVAALVLAAGCKPKPPAPPAPSSDPPRTTAPETPTEVTRSPRTDTGGDVTEAPWPTDLQEATDRAYREGLLGEVYYEFDSSTLSDAARDRLARNAQFLKDHPDYVVTIEGHCDERGTNEYNLALGERRASSAQSYLTSLGIASGRLRTISYGEERPQCTQSSESCWQQNRRAYFKITGRQ
ncbi:MAG TPA: peptidoglycan-associated lipoprotein Pal [Thermoanaerobaculia bacterium]|nr:peptidoglycan-associated lipoprotein Pal [Thermoanaerobaculia bacterium]